MLFVIPKGEHSKEQITSILSKHPEVKFVSLSAIDHSGQGTDEKIPVAAFIKDMKNILNSGVQTDGSSVALPKIADVNNGKVAILPDLDVNWYVDHNFNYIDYKTNLPVATLRIPSFLLHNDNFECGSRVFLHNTLKHFSKKMMELLSENPYIFNHLNGVNNIDEIENIEFTCATELEFWVKTPEDIADREQLSTAQVLKEQYWKRTIGTVRTALEETLIFLDKYGFEIEMGHKEVGGVKAKLDNSGNYGQIMEQLEIDWKYADAMQAADNEYQIRHIIRDIFTKHGLEVSFLAKPIEGVAGNGEHTHLGLIARLKSGEKVNLFAAKDVENEFMSPIGMGALMGFLKNYEVVSPFISATTDSFNRLKPGYEAPVCVVTSLGESVSKASRNRTILVGLIRDINNAAATRFEVRSPNPKSNTYLVIAASYLAALDGINAAVSGNKISSELEKSISKKHGEDDFYLEKNREYRSEEDVFEYYTQEERNILYGIAPETVYENISAFSCSYDKMQIYLRDDVISPLIIESFKEQTLSQWKTELKNRIVPEVMSYIRSCVELKDGGKEVKDHFDRKHWIEINALRAKIGKNTEEYKCLLTEIVEALECDDYETASVLQKELQKAVSELGEMYSIYKKNLF